MSGARRSTRSTKLAACLAGMALLVAALLYFASDGRDEGRGRTTLGASPEPVQADLADVAEIEGEFEAPSSASVAVAATREAAPVAAAPAVPNDWRGELAGLIGRVVESDGTPVVGMRVALLELDASLLFDGSSIDADEPRLELEETVTDREGRFLLGGARGPAFHGLGVDLGGPRATIRVIDHALPHRERTDIGDVVLAPFGVLTGRVVDASGAPIAGARVRFGPFPEEVLRVSPQEFRVTSLISVGPIPLGQDGHEIIDLPDWVRRTIDRLPVPTTYSGSDGRFRLEGVPLAPVVGGIDKPGYVGVTSGPNDMSAGEVDIGDAVLARGRTVRGVVEDGFGEPVAGAEVYAGAELFPGMAALLQSCGPSDEDGRFELSGVPESGLIVAAARRARHEPWSTTTTTRPDGVTIEIEATVQLTVSLRDERGEPLSGARLQLAPQRKLDSGRGAGEIFMVLPRNVSPPAAFDEVEPGRYVNTSLGAGIYDLTARVAGLAPAYARAECLGPINEIALVARAGRRVELTVIDAATKTPIEGARASVLRVDSAGFSKIGGEQTDADGRAWLGPLSEPVVHAQQGFLPTETMLLVQHPRYGDHSADLDPDVSPLVVALEGGGVLAGRVHWGGAVPTRLYMLMLEFHGADGFLEAFHLPRFALTDPAGEFRVADLAPGEYRVELSERFLDQDPLSQMVNEFEPVLLHRAEIEIRVGETTELVIDLTPTGRGPTARIFGRVRVEGRSLEGAEVVVQGGARLSLTTDAGGRFETPPVPIQNGVWVQIEGDVPLADGSTRRMQLYHESLELEPDDVREIDLDVYPLTHRVRVLADGTGEPVAEATVVAHGSGSSQAEVRTDTAGEAELLLLQPGEYTVNARAGGFGTASTRVTVAAGDTSGPSELRLPHTVPCAGRVQFESAEAPESSGGFTYIHVRGEDNANSSGTPLQAPDYAFALDGLARGKYQPVVYAAGRQWQADPFELGPEGDRNLVLTVRPAED